MAPLGTTTNIASKTADAETSTHRKYRLQNAATRLLPGEKIASCMRCAAPIDPAYPGGGVHEHIEIHRADDGRVSLNNLMTCDRVWICPVCAAKIAERRREELRAVYERSGKYFALATFTLRHNLKTPLETSLDAIGVAFRRFKAGGWWQRLTEEYGIIGNIRALEITYGYKNGWHPHIHMLMVFDDQPGHANLEALEVAMKKRWLGLLSRVGASGTWDSAVDVSHDHARLAEYIAKHGYAPESEWTEAEEMTRSRSKTAKNKGLTPWGLLDKYDRGDKQAGALFVEYATATKGKRQLWWSPGLRDLLNVEELMQSEDSEEQPEAESTLFLNVHRAEWWILSLYRARPAVLDAVINNDLNEALRIIRVCGDHYRRKYAGRNKP